LTLRGTRGVVRRTSRIVAGGGAEVEARETMSTKLIRLLLWLAFLVALPVPYWVFEPGRVPTLWLGELSAFVVAMLMKEGGTVTRVIAALFTTQTLLAVGATYLLARLASRLIARVPAGGARTAVVVVAVVAILGASLLPLYRSPLVAGGAPVNVLTLFE
jgi:hypothetical protein